MLALFTFIHTVYHTHAQFRFREGVSRPPLVDGLRGALSTKTRVELLTLQEDARELSAEIQRALDGCAPRRK